MHIFVSCACVCALLCVSVYEFCRACLCMSFAGCACVRAVCNCLCMGFAGRACVCFFLRVPMHELSAVACVWVMLGLPVHMCVCAKLCVRFRKKLYLCAHYFVYHSHILRCVIIVAYAMQFLHTHPVLCPICPHACVNYCLHHVRSRAHALLHGMCLSCVCV